MSIEAPMYRLLDAPRPSSELGAWQTVAGEFSQVVGWTAFGDFLLRNPDDGYYAFLRAARPSLVPLKYNDLPAFRAGFLAPERGYLRAADVARQEGRLGALAADEVFAPRPDLPPAIRAPEHYHKENVRDWAARTATYYGVGRGAASDLVLRHLRPGDDFDLWRVTLGHILSEFSPSTGTLIEVGRCSHWLRPHQFRWTADGGFAWPVGYGSGQGGYSFDALPQFDWSVTLAWTGDHWQLARDKSVKPTVRITLPSRTLRHDQAAVHAVWSIGREKEVRFYGFRRRADQWRCTAETEWAEDRQRKADRRKRRARQRGHTS
jgi:hypothetical protein